MFELKAYNSQGTTPSYSDKRIHFDGVIDYVCPECKAIGQRKGSDLIYCPDVYDDIVLHCFKCMHEEQVFVLKDIRDGKIFIEKILDNWSVSLKEKQYIEVEEV